MNRSELAILIRQARSSWKRLHRAAQSLPFRTRDRFDEFDADFNLLLSGLSALLETVEPAPPASTPDLFGPGP